MNDFSFWLWTSIKKDATTAELQAKYANYKANGIKGIFLEGGIDEREFDLIKSNEMELHSWMWTTNRRDEWIHDHHPEWYQVSRSGKSCFDQPPYVGYYKWVNPVIPGVVDYINAKAEELATHPATDGVHLDYVRYPDVILPRALWETYGLDQTEELADYDFSYDEATRAAFKAVSGRDPLEIEDPAHDQEWLHFRYNAVTELVLQLVATVRSHNKRITAAVFPTPHKARRICRQDWDKWPLDAVCPMIYNSFYQEPIEWIGECLIENIQAVDYPVIAGLYLPGIESDEDFEKALSIVQRRGGAGVSFFGEMSDNRWEIVKRIPKD